MGGNPSWRASTPPDFTSVVNYVPVLCSRGPVAALALSCVKTRLSSAHTAYTSARWAVHPSLIPFFPPPSRVLGTLEHPSSQIARRVFRCLSARTFSLARWSHPFRRKNRMPLFLDVFLSFFPLARPITRRAPLSVVPFKPAKELKLSLSLQFFFPPRTFPVFFWKVVWCLSLSFFPPMVLSPYGAKCFCRRHFSLLWEGLFFPATPMSPLPFLGFS